MAILNLLLMHLTGRIACPFPSFFSHCAVTPEPRVVLLACCGLSLGLLWVVED